MPIPIISPLYEAGKNTEHLNRALLTLLATLFCSLLPSLLTPNNFSLVILSIIYALFFSFFRVGFNKKQQLTTLSFYSLLCFIIVGISIGLRILNPFLFHISLAILFFISLMIPRFTHHGFIPAIFLVCYILIVYMIAANTPSMPLSTLFNLHLMATLLNWIVYSVLIYFLPLVPMTPLIEGNHYYLKKALRLTLTLNFTFFIAYLANIQHITWICFSILLISQKNLGSTIKRAQARFLGTCLGGLTGWILAYLLFSKNSAFIYIDYLLIFFMVLMLYQNYAYAMFFGTILVISTYYLLLPAGITINQFVLARIGDTVLGISLGLLSEIFIFPASLLPTMRLHTKNTLKSLLELLQYYSTNTDAHLMTEKIKSIDLCFIQLQDEFNDFNSEPLVLLTQRYAYFKLINQHLKDLYRACQRLIHEENSLPFNTAELEALSNVVQMIIAIHPKTDAQSLKPALITLSQLRKNTALTQYTKIKILDQLEELIHLYQVILATPRLRLRWH